jgi:8-oxo-(d)GTP phosphatase
VAAAATGWPPQPDSILAPVDEASATTVVEVLRHAKACSREAWDGADDHRPLDDAGWLQAKHLTRDLAAAPLAAVYTSPAVRCTQTVEALAAAAETALVRDQRLAGLRTVPLTDDGQAWPAVAWLGGRALDLLDAVVARHRGARLLVCSHGDVLTALLATLVGRDGLDVHDIRLKKGGRVTLTFDAAGRCSGYTPVQPPA